MPKVKPMTPVMPDTGGLISKHPTSTLHDLDKAPSVPGSRGLGRSAGKEASYALKQKVEKPTNLKKMSKNIRPPKDNI